MSEEKDVQVVRVGNNALTVTKAGCYYFDIIGSEQMAATSLLPFYSNTRQLQPTRIGDFEIVANGSENNYPDEIRQILDENNLTPEVLNKQAQLLWGQGPALYRIKFENGRRMKYWDVDPAIQAWLDSWDYEDYLLKASIEFRTLNGHFTKFYRNRGARIAGSQASIAKLEHVSGMYSRLEWPDQENQIRNIIVGDFRQPWKSGLRRYPVFTPDNPFSNPVSMRYSNLYSFALDLEYSRSPIHSAMNWIKLGSSIPKLLSNFNANSMAIKYHIEVPQVYWQQMRQQLEQECVLNNVPFTEKAFEKLKDDTFKAVSLALSGKDKVGKFISTEKVFDDTANEYVGWVIKELDQKIGDFVKAQIEISNQSLFEITSAMGLHPALSNLSKDGNLPSGSEQLYAFKLYLATGVDIPESIVMRDINLAIKANFPTKDLRLGFYHDIVMTEEKTNPNDRLKNAV
jgi:hypothetical protein